MGWTTPFKSIDAATSSATGMAVDLDEIKASHAAQAFADLGNAGDRVDVVLQGSLDGVAWYTLASASLTGADPAVALLVSMDKPARYARALSFVVAGTSTTTVLVASQV